MGRKPQWQKRKKASLYCLANWHRPSHATPKKMNCFLVEGDSAGGVPSKDEIGSFKRFCLCEGSSIRKKPRCKTSWKTKKSIRWFIPLVPGSDQNLPLKMRTMTRWSSWRMRIRWGPHPSLATDVFYRYMKPLIEAGRVYIALPLYTKYLKVPAKSGIEYAWTDEELQSVIQKGRQRLYAPTV